MAVVAVQELDAGRVMRGEAEVSQFETSIEKLPDEREAIDRPARTLPHLTHLLGLCQSVSGMGFVAVLRPMTGERNRWKICAASDRIGLGLKEGDEIDRTSGVPLPPQNGLTMMGAAGNADTAQAAVEPLYDFRDRIFVPITRPDGMVLGMLCAFDPEAPRNGFDRRHMFKQAAQVISVALDLKGQLDLGQETLLSERDTARLREEFIAVVGHDLRTPVAAISAGLGLLRQAPHPDQADSYMLEMERSVLRMQQIIDNLLDFAQGRLGSGISLKAHEAVDLEPMLRVIVQEIGRVADQPIALTLDLPHPVRCDPQRIGQLVSNLLGNAANHGAPGEEIRIDATAPDGPLRIAVTNRGVPIPEHMRPSLFLPFARSSRSCAENPGGLGLGLYIASEIAEAHGGRLDVVSTELSTTFTFTCPGPDLLGPGRD